MCFFFAGAGGGLCFFFFDFVCVFVSFSLVRKFSSTSESKIGGIFIGRFCHPPCLLCVFIASLTLTMLWADSADNNWMIFFKIFPENRI